MNTKNSSQQVFGAVRKHLQVLRAEIAEPVRVREEELASQLGVSRTPVREALIRLDSEGMISLRSGRGALLYPVTERNYLEWLQIREQLEGVAAREAAMNASKRDVDGLRAIFAPFSGITNFEQSANAYSEANVLFHKEIIRLCGNDLLHKIWMSFGHLEISHRHQTIARLHRHTDSLREHLAIIDAIEKRAPDLADSLARAHVQSLAVSLKQASTAN